MFWEATPGRHVVEVEDQIAEGDKVVTRVTSYGRHEGDLPGIPRTGNDMEMTATVIHRIADGQLAEKWSDKDVLRMLQQLRGHPADGAPTGVGRRRPGGSSEHLPGSGLRPGPVIPAVRGESAAMPTQAVTGDP